MLSSSSSSSGSTGSSASSSATTLFGQQGSALLDASGHGVIHDRDTLRDGRHGHVLGGFADAFQSFQDVLFTRTSHLYCT